MGEQGENGYAAVAQDRARDRARVIAEGLRRVADDIERVRVNSDLNDVKPDYGRFAADIQHKVIWGIANLHLDGLIRDCSAADRAVREPESPE